MNSEITKDAKFIDLKDINLYVRFAQVLYGTDQNYYLPWRILYDNFLLFVVEGSMILRFETHDILIHENELCIIPPFLKNRLVVPKDTTFRYYGIHFDFFYDDSESFNEDVYIPENLGLVKADIVEMPEDQRLIHRDVYKLQDIDFPEKISITHPAQFTGLIASLVEKFEAKPWGYELFIKSKMYELLYLLLVDIRNVSGTELKDMSNICRYIKNVASDFGSKVQIVEIALEYGMAPARFRSIFKSITSQTPKEYIVENKMNHARELLESGEYNVSQVAYMLGYDDVSYFSKLFKRKMGNSPKKFIGMPLF